MRTRALLVLGALGAVALAAQAAEMVGVAGSGTQYPDVVTATVGGREVTLALTGAALRTKYFLNIYTVASYAAPGAGAGSAEGLVAADEPKQLHLVMECGLTGAELADAITAAVRLNHPAPAFAAELASLTDCLKALTVAKGDHVRLTHVPGVGLHCEVAGKADTTIRSVAFAQAVWEIYLGKNNLGEEIKKGLLSRR